MLHPQSAHGPQLHTGIASLVPKLPKGHRGTLRFSHPVYIGMVILPLQAWQLAVWHQEQGGAGDS